MSRGVFRSHNKVGEIMSFQTNSDSGTTFDPIVVFAVPLGDRVSWDLGEGSGYTATNSLSYTYSDTGLTKTVTIRTNKLSDLGEFYGNSDNIIGNINMSGWGLKKQFLVQDNPDLLLTTYLVSWRLGGQSWLAFGFLYVLVLFFCGSMAGYASITPDTWRKCYYKSMML